MKKIITTLALSVVTVSQLAAQPLSLTLQDCRKLALEHNEQIKTANNAVEKAKLDRQIAFAQYLPKVDGSLTGIHMKDQDIIGMSLQTRGTYLAGINVTLPLYAGGQLTAANRLAQIGQTVSEEQQRKARMQVIADVDNSYYSLIAVRSKVQMLKAYAQQMQELYDRVQLSVRVQMATENDLLRIASKQSEISYLLQKATNGEQLCQLALANQIGTDFERAIILLTPASMPQLSEDFSARPDLHLLQQQVKANELQVKRARANYLPTVALVGTYSHYDNLKLKGALRNLDGTPINVNHTFSGGRPYALLSVNVPIFHWGAELKKVKKAKLDLSDSQLQACALRCVRLCSTSPTDNEWWRPPR